MTMPRLVTERLNVLRQEISEISKANEMYLHQKGPVAASDRERRKQRLEEIMAELKSLTEWKKP